MSEVPAGAFGPVPVALDRLGRPIAEWWQRLLAILLDGMLLGALYWILFLVIVGSSVDGSFRAPAVRLWLVHVLTGLAALAYFALLQGGDRGQSVGQVLLGIAVRDADLGGRVERLAAGRRIVLLAPWLVLIWIPVVGGTLSLVGELWTLVCGLSPLWNPERRGYHDLAQRTNVVRLR